MAAYCDPSIDFLEWHEVEAYDAEAWHAPRDLDFAQVPFGPRTETIESLEEEFARLVTAWREATGNISSLTQVVSHFAYQRIIDLGKRGEPVVSLILRDLQKNRGYWAMALQAITGENPVPAKHIGNPAKVREDWLEWGARHGYL